MSAVDTPKTEASTSTPSNSPVLEPKLDPRWALRLLDVLVVASCAVLYLIVSYLPLTDPAIWNAVTYGESILRNRALPTSDEVMRFSTGMKVVDTQWLSEVILASVARIGDVWLSTLCAVVVLATMIMYGRAYWLLSRQLTIAWLTTAIVLAIAWPRYMSLHPELLAGLCFAALLWVGAAARESDAQSPWPLLRWLFIACVFVLWANLDGSFVWGLAVLAAWAVGHAFDAAWRHGSWRQVFRDRYVQRWVFALELALVASCIHPHGIDQLLHVVWYAPRANLAELAEWQPLVLLQGAGPGFAVSIVCLLALFRYSRAPLRSADLLALAVIAVATIFYQRMILWYAPLFGFVLAPQLAERCVAWSAARSVRSAPTAVPASEAAGAALPPGHSWTYTLMAALFVWIAFAFSDASRPLLGGQSRTPQQIYGQNAPLGLAAFLRKEPPRENVFNPAGWGDLLYRQTGGDWQPFATHRVTALPRQVWIDYNHVASSQGGWRNVLDRYEVHTVIVDRQRQPALATGLRLDPTWEVRFQDEQAIVFREKAS